MLLLRIEWAPAAAGQHTVKFILPGSGPARNTNIHTILSNAIRHSPEGAEVFIRLTPSALAVTNTGTSIPKEDLPVLFTPFYRWHLHSTQKAPFPTRKGAFLLDRTSLRGRGVRDELI